MGKSAKDLHWLAPSHLSRLTRWCAVFLAYRCAQKVKHLYHGDSKSTKIIHRAITLAEHAAMHAQPVDADKNIDRISKYIYQESRVKNEDISEKYYSAAAAYSAYLAAKADSCNIAINSAAEAADFAYRALQAAGSSKHTVSQFQAEVQQDLAEMLRRADTEKWDDNSPISASIFLPFVGACEIRLRRINDLLFIKEADCDSVSAISSNKHQIVIDITGGPSQDREDISRRIEDCIVRIFDRPRQISVDGPKVILREKSYELLRYLDKQPYSIGKTDWCASSIVARTNADSYIRELVDCGLVDTSGSKTRIKYSINQAGKAYLKAYFSRVRNQFTIASKTCL